MDFSIHPSAHAALGCLLVLGFTMVLGIAPYKKPYSMAAASSWQQLS
jgi:hypothetical protein